MPLSEWSVQVSEAKDNIMPFTSCATQCAAGYTATATSLTLWHKDHKDHETLQAFLFVGLTILALPQAVQENDRKIAVLPFGLTLLHFWNFESLPKELSQRWVLTSNDSLQSRPMPCTHCSIMAANRGLILVEMRTSNWCPDTLMNLVPSNLRYFRTFFDCIPFFDQYHHFILHSGQPPNSISQCSLVLIYSMPPCLSEVEFHHKKGPCQDGSTITSGHLGRDKHQQTCDTTDTYACNACRVCLPSEGTSLCSLFMKGYDETYIWQSHEILGGIRIAWVMAGCCVLGHPITRYIEQWQVNMCDPVPRNLAGENLWDLGLADFNTDYPWLPQCGKLAQCFLATHHMLDVCFNFLQLCASMCKQILFCSSLLCLGRIYAIGGLSCM